MKRATKVPNFTHEQLLAALSYDAETGVFTWNNGPRAGRSAGYVRAKKRHVVINSPRLTSDNDGLLAHRLAWFYVHRVWPNSEIDHINGIGSDNRITNLRLAPDGANQQNMTAGRGATFLPASGKWRSQISVRGRNVCLGDFETQEQARAVYLAAKAEYHPFWAGRT